AGGGGGGAGVWGGARGGPMADVAHGGTVLSLAFSHDGRSLATAGEDGNVRLWDAATGAASGPTLPHGGVVRAVAYRPDGRVLATAGDDCNARLWDADSGQQYLAEPLRHDGPVVSLVFRPDG